MSATPTTILRTGLVTSVGHTASTSCAAFRAKLANPTETRFIDSSGEWIMAHQVALDQPWRGIRKLARMTAMAIDETLMDVPKNQWSTLPLILCVAETDRPGRLQGLDDMLAFQIQSDLGVKFSEASTVIAGGRVGVASALAHARALISSFKLPRVLVAAADSLLSWSTLSQYARQDRLLGPANSNGFMPGEAAGALLVAEAKDQVGALVCTGIGFSREVATIESEKPLRAEGLSQAIRHALSDGECQMHDIDFRITDNSGEQYYFKEAALALSRTLRVRKEEFDIWHPAECTGEVGAASGAVILATAWAACNKRYAKGSNVLTHMSNDAGERAALVLQYGGASR